MKLILSCFGKDKLTRQEKLEFLDYLKNSLENGFSLNNSIELMPVMWSKKQQLMLQLNRKMKNGAHFADQLLLLGFSKTTVTQINLSLRQGNLIDCLNQIAVLTRLKNEQIKKLKAEMSYPFILAGIMIFLLVFMQTFVSTQFQDNNEYSGDLLLISLAGVILGGMYFFARVLKLLAKEDYQSMKKLTHYLFIGPVIKTYINYLLVYDIGLLLSSGFSLQKMCKYAAEQEKGSLQQHLGKKIGEKLATGSSLEEIIKTEEFLPDVLLILLSTGAKKENLSRQCLVLGRSIFIDLTGKIEKMVVNVQPICFILLGVCVIGMYLKLLLPMYSMIQGI